MGADTGHTGDSTNQSEEHCLLLEQEEDEEHELHSHSAANVASGFAGHEHQLASFECSPLPETISSANVAVAAARTLAQLELDIDVASVELEHGRTKVVDAAKLVGHNTLHQYQKRSTE